MPLLAGCGRYSVDKTVFILYNAQRLKMGSRNAAHFVCQRKIGVHIPFFPWTWQTLLTTGSAVFFKGKQRAEKSFGSCFLSLCHKK